MNENGLFLSLVQVLTSGSSNSGKDKGALIPLFDAQDMKNGATYVPAEVTEARRSGKEVEFCQSVVDNPRTWYWRFKNGTRFSYRVEIR